MLTYIFMLMTSWAIVCDVTYLEPTKIMVTQLLKKSFLFVNPGG